MKHLILFTLFCSIVFLISGQNSPVEVTYNFNPDYTVDFFYRKPLPGNYLIKLSFSRVENAVVTGVSEVVKALNGKVYTLLPAIQGQPVRFSLQYSALRGLPDPKADTNFVCLLPVAGGKSIQVEKVSSFTNYSFFVERRQKWDYFLFHTDPDEPIFSVRKGVVVEVNEGADVKETDVFPFTVNKLNAITIEHEDGTLACYSLLKKGSILVKPGDAVIPNTPLANAGSLSGSGSLLFCLTYLKTAKADPRVSTRSDSYHYSQIDPLFSTTTGNVRLLSGKGYTSRISNEQIVKELNKKEQKKIGK